MVEEVLNPGDLAVADDLPPGRLARRSRSIAATKLAGKHRGLAAIAAGE